MKALSCLVRKCCYLLILPLLLCAQANAQSGSTQITMSITVPFNENNGDLSSKAGSGAALSYRSETYTPLIQMSDNATPLKIWISI